MKPSTLFYFYLSFLPISLSSPAPKQDEALVKRLNFNVGSFLGKWEDGTTSSSSDSSVSNNQKDSTSKDSTSKSSSSGGETPESQNLKNIPGTGSGNSQLPSPGTSDFNNLISEINAASTPIGKAALLGPDGSVFNFFESASFGGGGKDGGVVLADDTLFPAVVGQGVAMLMGFLGPCGMVAPHSHPRAVELLYLISGPPLNYGMITEGGGVIVSGIQPVGSAILLPKGSMHYVQNSGCDPAVLVAGFDNESPGALFLAQAYSAFDAGFYSAAFGETVTVLEADKIPNAVNIGTKSCLKKCGLDASTLDISSWTKQEILLESYAKYLESVGYNW